MNKEKVNIVFGILCLSFFLIITIWRPALPEAPSRAPDYKTVDLQDEAKGLVKALSDKKVYENFKKVMKSGNRITAMTADINQKVIDMSEIIYRVTVQDCTFFGPRGDRCFGGAVLIVTANTLFVPGEAGGRTSYESEITYIKSR